MSLFCLIVRFHFDRERTLNSKTLKTSKGSIEIDLRTCLSFFKFFWWLFVGSFFVNSCKVIQLSGCRNGIWSKLFPNGQKTEMRQSSTEHYDLRTSLTCLFSIHFSWNNWTRTLVETQLWYLMPCVNGVKWTTVNKSEKKIHIEQRTITNCSKYNNWNNNLLFW